MKTHRGFTLPELMIAMTVAFVLVGGGYFMLNMATDVYRKVSGHEDGALQMKKVARKLQKDLLTGNPSLTNIAIKSGPLGNTGDVVWTLSSASGSAASGPTNNTESGAPFWQRNVIYYPARPTGDTCAGVVDADGYEVGCPHKIILRKVVDSAPTTLPLVEGGNSSTDKEKILEPDQIGAYLTRPAGLGITAMLGEPAITDIEIVGVNILTMRVEKDPEPNSPGEIKITLQTFNELAGARTTNVGSTDLSNHAKTLTHVISVFPRNNQ